MFYRIPDAEVVIVNRGIYRNAPLYQRAVSSKSGPFPIRGEVYAKIGSGYVKLRPRGHTSNGAKWEQIVGIYYDEGPLVLERV